MSYKEPKARKPLTPEQLRKKMEALHHPACVAARAKGHPPYGPIKYSMEVAEAICHRISTGQTLYAAINGFLATTRTVHMWLQEHPEFRAMYEEARRNQAEFLLDEAIDTARKGKPKTAAITNVQAAVYMKAAAMIHPKKYAGKTHVVEHTGEVKHNLNMESLSTDDLVRLRELRLKLATGTSGN